MDREDKVSKGLEIILPHLYDTTHEEYNLFPRRISTRLSDNKQFSVYSQDEAFVHFRRSYFTDCRISAYPFVDRHPPNLIFIDLDYKNNYTQFRNDINNTCNKIKKFLGGYPTVLLTGNGCHIYMPINCNKSLILSDGFSNKLRNKIIDLRINVTSTFLKFCEQFLSDGKADMNHNPSIKSCMLRIPGSLNFKPTDNLFKHPQEVKLLQEWDGIRPHMEFLLADFNEYLDTLKPIPFVYDGSGVDKIDWIDLLINIPIPDNRKYVLWKILCPYLINVKQYNYDECFKIVEGWLIKCNELKSLNFNINSEVKTKLRYVKHYKPLSLSKVYNDNKDL